MHNGMI